MGSLLSDDLLESLIATGEVDVLVCVPTHNHARTVGEVVRAVVSAFSGPLVRQRTVLLNLDAGSTDATVERIHDTTPTAELVSTEYALRTLHRITAPYHGLSGRGAALRVSFTAAELLRARAVVVLDPTASPITARDVAAMVFAVLQREADYVKPALPRERTDGPLVTQLIRPLFRAAYGYRMLEPIDTQLACSGRLASTILHEGFWQDARLESSVDAFLSCHAMNGGYRLGQVATAARARVHRQRRLKVAEVFRQVVSGSLTCLARTYADWKDVTGSRPVAVEGTVSAAGPGPEFDREAFVHAYRDGVQALSPLLSRMLDSDVVERLRVEACAAEPAIDDTLWADTVFQCLGVLICGDATSNELARLLEPLYLGRVAFFLRQDAGDDADDPAESLSLAFEARKPSFVTGLQDQES